MRKNKKYSGVKVLLVDGADRQTLPLSEAFTKLGCLVITLNTSKFDNGYVSRYPKKKILKKELKETPEKLKYFILDLVKQEDYNLIVATSDTTAEILSNSKEELEKFTKVAVVNKDLFDFAYDKSRTMQICMENNIPCPKTFLDIEDIKDIPFEKLTFPMVIKPKKSYGAIGYKKVENESELIKFCEGIKDKLKNYVFQEYIPQTNIQYECAMFLDKDANVKTSTVFSKNRWFPVDGGSSTFNISVDIPEIKETCIKLLKIINWRGAADIDLIYDPRDGAYKVLEINPRVSGSVKILFKSGVNIAEQIIQDNFGEEVTDYTRYKTGVRLRCIHTDLLWFIKSKERFRAKPCWFSLKWTYDQIWSLKDPLPFFSFSFQAIGKYKKEMKKRKR